MSSWLPGRPDRPARPVRTAPGRLAELLPAGVRGRLPAALRRPEPAPAPAPVRRSRLRIDPASWSGAMIIILALTAVLWAVQTVNSYDGYGLNRFGVRPRQLDGLWGVLSMPWLHASWGHLLSNTVPFVLVGWTLLLAGLRPFLFVTVVVVVVGDFGTWLVAPSGHVVIGASGLVFGWLGYLLSRAWFSRRLKWIVTAVALLVVFGTLLGSLLPTVETGISWQAHLCGFVAGIGLGWLLHERPSAGGRVRRRPGARRPNVR